MGPTFILPRYQLRDLLHDGLHTVVQRAIRDDGTRVLLKILKSEQASPAERARLHKEYEVACRVPARAVVQPLELIDQDGPYGHDGRLVLVLLDDGGQSLAEVLATRRLGLDEGLRIGLLLTEALGILHQADVFHQDLTPHNIIVDPSPALRWVKLTDFGSALHGLQRDVPEAVPETEPLGRDPRRDLAACGAVLYQMFTGRCPSESPGSDGPREPVPLHEFDAALPEMMSRIVRKLLAERPEDRYHSARGLHADLLVCQRELERHGTIPLFALGQNDTPTAQWAPRENLQPEEATLDLAAVVEAQQIIAGEIELGQLLSSLLRVLMKHTGARRGVVLLEKDGRLTIEAACRALGEAITVQESIPFERSGELPATVVEHVWHSGEHVVIEDATRDGRFGNDPYIVRQRPRSVLCLPIVHQAEPAGLVYLESDQTGAFTAGRLQLLAILLVQAAASLAHARRHHLLERRVEDRTRELHDKNAELESTRERLRETQQQLVMQEKLASLGALTAGIAHEIKNPLNFITNFAQLSVDLGADLRQELAAHDATLNPALREQVTDIVSDLEDNLQKIRYHGQRVDSIVRSMLDHSRGGKAEYRSIQLNQLVTDYLHLARQGMRPAEGERGVTIEADLDPTLAPIEAMPQELGRVLLNLLNNAWYALRAKARQLGPSFVPTITVRTHDLGEAAELRIRDNGPGVPRDIEQKIFQPFFTTKPTGEGTGLGLSISHDIIVQGAGGTLRIETEEGEFAEFIITLPHRRAAATNTTSMAT